MKISLLKIFINKKFFKLLQIIFFLKKNNIMIEDKIDEKLKNTINQIKKQRYDNKKQSLSLYKITQWKLILQDHNWINLKILILTKNKITDQGLQIILKQDWKNLQQLWINQNQITNIGAQKFGAKIWPKLSDLSLVDNMIKDTDIIFKILNKNIPNLKCINLGSNNLNKRKKSLITIQSQSFIKYPEQILINIQILNVSNNRLGVYGSSLVSKLNTPNLKNLIMNQCHLGTFGINNITKGNWPCLENFQGGYNDLGIDGFQTFINNNWKQVKKISLYGNLISRVGSTFLILLVSNKIEESKISLWGMMREDLQKQNSKIIALSKPNKYQNRRYGW